MAAVVRALTAFSRRRVYSIATEQRRTAISKEREFNECVVLARDAFDPDAVFLDDIVNDDVLPRLNLAVDGLTAVGKRSRSKLEMLPRDAANESIPPSTSLPVAALDPDHLEVYGWESSFWRKIRGYLGF